MVHGITKQNLHVLTGAEVTKIQLDKPAGSSDVHASGVEFVKNRKAQVLRLNPGGKVVLTAGKRHSLLCILGPIN